MLSLPFGSSVTVRHWLPIVTICPVNSLPDLLYVSLTFPHDAVPELYAVRKQLRRFNFRRAFMEDIALSVTALFPKADVSVRLAFSRHEVHIPSERWF